MNFYNFERIFKVKNDDNNNNNRGKILFHRFSGAANLINIFNAC